MASHMASWKLELETHSRAPRQAKPHTVAILVSLEVFVLDTEQDMYFRFIAWTMLIACWTSLRVDDIQNILPESLKYHSVVFLQGFPEQRLRVQAKCMVSFRSLCIER